MKKQKLLPLPKNLEKALKLFPQIVAKNKTEKIKKQRFADKVFGEIARKVHRQVHGKNISKRSSG